MRAVALLPVALFLLGCALDPSEPVVFSGRLEDRLGKPVPNATVVLEAYDLFSGPAGAPPPVAFRAETTTAADGQFEFRFGPSDELRQLEGRNRTPLSFTAWVRMPERNLKWSFRVRREIGRNGWAETATPVHWRPSP